MEIHCSVRFSHIWILDSGTPVLLLGNQACDSPGSSLMIISSYSLMELRFPPHLSWALLLCRVFNMTFKVFTHIKWCEYSSFYVQIFSLPVINKMQIIIVNWDRRKFKYFISKARCNGWHGLGMDCHRNRWSNPHEHIFVLICKYALGLWYFVMTNIKC